MSTPAPMPALAPIPKACEYSGLSRSGIYRGLSLGTLRAVKHGRTTLIDMPSLQSYIENLPKADFRMPARVA